MLVRFTMAYRLTILNQWNSNKLLRTWSKTQLAMSWPKAGCLSPSFSAPCIFQSSFSSFTFACFLKEWFQGAWAVNPSTSVGMSSWARPSDWREIALDYPSGEKPWSLEPKWHTLLSFCAWSSCRDFSSKLLRHISKSSCSRRSQPLKFPIDVQNILRCHDLATVCNSSLTICRVNSIRPIRLFHLP